jgi:hypothetical protein
MRKYEPFEVNIKAHIDAAIKASEERVTTTLSQEMKASEQRIIKKLEAVEQKIDKKLEDHETCICQLEPAEFPRSH